ncbi:MAG: hypothetical protein ACYC2K_12350, partial [Gemmatimonadales bacterium]
MGLAWFAALLLLQEPPIDLRRIVEPGPAPAEQRGVAAQAAFERERRFRLPATGGGGGRCDERIGRFCYWYDDRDTSLPSEPLSVLKLRMNLLGTLRGAAAEEPSSDWLIGQLVRYAVEHGERDSALAAATRCGASPWWCEAIRGFALHLFERDADADTAYQRAIAIMPDSLRCAWTDWTRVLEPAIADRFEALDCAARLALADTVLWLAKPLLSRPGNVIRSELLSRRIVAALGWVSRSPYAISWGRDMEELVLRYGWSRRFSVVDHRSRSLEGPSVVGHQRAPAYPMIPDAGRGDNDPQWIDVLEKDRPRSRFSPEYIGQLESTEAFQLARFPRGDSSIVVGGIEPGETLDRAGRFDLALAAGSGPDGTVIDRRDSTAALAGLKVTIPGRALVASVEVAAAGGRHFVRGREYYEPINRPAPIVLSDLLLFAPGDELPTTLDAAAALALPSNRLSRTKPVGIYWEATGAANDSVMVAVSVNPVRRGLLGRIGQGLSVVRKDAPVTL